MTEETCLTGGCICGAIRYRILGRPRLVCSCHCSMCRRASGAPMLTWMAIRKDRFELISDAVIWYRSSEQGRRGFCATCGGQLLSVHAGYQDYYEVTVGTLDNPERVRPDRHVYEPDRLSWLLICDGLPRHLSDARSPLVDPEAYHVRSTT